MRRHHVSICLLAVLCFAPALAAPEPEECGEAKLSVELLDQQEGDGQVRFRFEVKIEAGASCSALTYDFLVEEMLPNLQAKTVRQPRQVELKDGKLTEIVEHSMTTDLKLLGYDVDLVECDCGSKSS